MQDKAIERNAESDDAVLGLLLYDHAGLWSVAEVEREIGDAVAATDSLARLVGGGLAHRLDSGFIMASRAARLAAEITVD